MVGRVFSLMQPCLFVKNVNSYFSQSTAGFKKVTTLLLLATKSSCKIISLSFNKCTHMPVYNTAIV